MTDRIISLRPFIDGMEEQSRQVFFSEMEEQRQVELEQEENWSQQRAIHGFEGEDDIPADDGYRFFDPDDPTHIMDAFERLIEQQRAEDIEFDEALAVIKGLVDRSFPEDDAPAEPELEMRIPDLDEPLTLFEVICLPELGGQLFLGSDVPGRPGRIAVKTLRAEIAAGRLRRVPPLNKNIYVSRRTIKEWTEWRDDGSLPISFGSSPNTPVTGDSGRTAIGRSQTGRPDLAQASALSIVNRLRQRDSSMK